MESDLVLELGELSAKYHAITGLFCVVALPTLVINVLLLFIVFRSTNFRDLSTMLVVFVSIADLLYVAYLCGYIALYYLHVYIPDIACAIVITIQSILRMVPSLTLVLVAFNWYVAKFKPTACYKFHQIHRISLKCFLATWLVSIATNVGIPFVVCHQYHKVGFVVYSVVMNFVVHFVLLVVEIYLHCKNLRATRKELANKSGKNNQLSYNLQITKVFLALSVAYFIFTAPLLLYRLVEIAMGVSSRAFAVYTFHILSCLPCLMNPVSLYFISQKFQEELRGMFGKVQRNNKTTTSPAEKQSAIAPELFSVNKGLFETRTPAWMQDRECNKRELIYGEYPSMAPPKEKPKKSKKNVRFSDIEDNIPDIPELPSSNSKTDTTRQIVVPAGVSQRITTVTQDDHCRYTPTPHSSPTSTPPSGTWPRCQASPYHRYPTIDEIRQQGSLLQQNQHFKRNVIGRSASVFEPSRYSNEIQRSTVPDEACKNVATSNCTNKTQTANVQQSDVCKEETVLKTSL